VFLFGGKTMELKDKVAVVTGGASGIGFAICKRFLKNGAKVVVADVKGVEEAVEALGGNAIGRICDVSREQEVCDLMQFVVDQFGALDIAVANAGILRDGLLLKVNKETGKVEKVMPLSQWQQVIDVNLTGVFLTGREAAKQMINLGKGGVIILMSSISKEGNFGQSNYSAAKAGVAALGVVWSKELARYRIRVATIAPGFIGTPMVLKDMKQEALEAVKKQIPVGRLGDPDEIAMTAQFIVENDLVTGTCFEITGGMRL
jgi:3-oxoacyl-[acyl-carrier protein] reductase